MGRKKAFLKNIRVSSVDLCRRGANPEAEILLTKSEEEQTQQTDTETAEENTIDLDPIFEAVKESITSILSDTSMEEKERLQLLAETIAQFSDELLQTVHKIAVGEEAEQTEEVEKEAPELDLEQMSPKDKKAYESLLKKYKKKKKKEAEEDSEVKKAIYEIHAAKNELQELKKQYEMSFLEETAKKYEVIGKERHTLAQRLYQLKKNSVSAYNDYLALLDEQMEMTEKSGIFKEVGTSRPGGKSAVKQLQQRAEELMKIDNSLTYIQAFIKACDENPQLRAEYEEQ